jgi:hypothetical protein
VAGSSSRAVCCPAVFFRLLVGGMVTTATLSGPRCAARCWGLFLADPSRLQRLILAPLLLSSYCLCCTVSRPAGDRPERTRALSTATRCRDNSASGCTEHSGDLCEAVNAQRGAARI